MVQPPCCACASGNIEGYYNSNASVRTPPGSIGSMRLQRGSVPGLHRIAIVTAQVIPCSGMLRACHRCCHSWPSAACSEACLCGWLQAAAGTLLGQVCFGRCGRCGHQQLPGRLAAMWPAPGALAHQAWAGRGCPQGPPKHRHVQPHVSCGGYEYHWWICIPVLCACVLFCIWCACDPGASGLGWRGWAGHTGCSGLRAAALG